MAGDLLQCPAGFIKKYRNETLLADDLHVCGLPNDEKLLYLWRIEIFSLLLAFIRTTWKINCAKKMEKYLFYLLVFLLQIFQAIIILAGRKRMDTVSIWAASFNRFLFQWPVPRPVSMFLIDCPAMRWKEFTL